MKSFTTDTKHPTILIIDDQSDNIQVLAVALEMHGYSITYALSGKEAFQRLKAIQPDLILMDLFMPGLNGLQVCELIKADPNYQDIPILFLTASHDEQNLFEAFEKGAADYVTKPFKTMELLARVKTHIKLKQQAREIKNNKDKLETIVTHIKDGILVVDNDGKILFANPPSAQMFNKPLSDLIGYELGIPIVKQKITTIDIFRPNREVGKAEITVAEAEWEEQPVSVVCLRDVTDLYPSKQSSKL